MSAEQMNVTVEFTNDVISLIPAQLAGFFADWPDHPDAGTHLEILQKSYAVWLAVDGERCVGFINAISDGVMHAYIPLLEVLPEYRGRGIGTELVRRMAETLRGMYAIDIVCDESIASFYAGKGFSRCVGMIKRNYDNQGAASRPDAADA